MKMTREEANEILEDWNLCHYTPSREAAEAVISALDPLEIISALRPVSREQVEKMGKGEWEDMREAYNDVPKRRCSRCKRVFIGLDKPFCEACGAPMTDEAVEMVMERFGGATR